MTCGDVCTVCDMNITVQVSAGSSFIYRRGSSKGVQCIEGFVSSSVIVQVVLGRPVGGL